MWLARDSAGSLGLYLNEPKKKKIVINPDFPNCKREIITWRDPEGLYYSMGIPNDNYPWVTFENSPIEVKFSPVH